MIEYYGLYEGAAPVSLSKQEYASYCSSAQCARDINDRYPHRMIRKDNCTKRDRWCPDCGNALFWGPKSHFKLTRDRG